MDWSKHDALSRDWTQKTHAYVRAVNDLLAREEGDEPVDPRDATLAAAVVDVVREANAAGAWRELRARFPTAHGPFIPILEQKAIAFRSVRFVDDRRVVAAIGTPWEPEAVVIVDEHGEVEHVPGGAIDVGSSPDRRHFALVYADRIVITEGLGGAEVARCPRPRGDEDPVEGLAPLGADAPWASIDEIVVIPGGRAVALATSCGVFLSSPSGVRRLCPDRGQLAERVAEAGETPYRVSTSMTHVAVHPRGELVACGHQGSQHELRGLGGELIAALGPMGSEYPHHAAFSPDGARVILNSCHFYNGVTSIARVDDLRGLRLPAYEEDARLLPLDGRARVYASSFVDDTFLLGDAHGFVRAIRTSGELAWLHFTGSAVGGVDVSPDGRRLAIGTHAGFLSLLERDDQPDPAQIGTGPFRERIRYVRWKGEPLLRW